MSAKATASVLSPPTRSFTPAPANLLQRKCACGGSAGLSGTCETCQQKTLTGQQPLLVQAKLTISQPNDKYEQEADRVADMVMRMPEPRVQRQVEAEGEEKEETIQTKPIASQIMPLIQRQAELEEEEEELLQAKPQVQRQAGSALKTPPETPSIVHEVLRSSGQPLDALTRTFMESRFGHDFRQVQVHPDARAAASAEAVNARAYTVGRNIVFGRGQYLPQTTVGQRLLAHELTHVVQQNHGSSPATLRRVDYGSGVPPHTNFVEVPPEDVPSVDQGIQSAAKIVISAENRCHKRFEAICPGASGIELIDQFVKAEVWKTTDRSNFGQSVLPNHVAYGDETLRWGRFMIASTLIHEFMHNCGVGGSNDDEAEILATERICGLPGLPPGYSG